MIEFKNAMEAAQIPACKKALVELLYQLADDDFILAFRGSEWLGVAPHIEADLAFSSINQNTMGHAVIYYELLEKLGAGKADDIAHLREPKAFRNAMILEAVNGAGHYLKEPKFDWAFAVVRHYFYEMAKMIRLNALKRSSYKPLAMVAGKMQMEAYYHVMHWRTWFYQLVRAKGEAEKRMQAAIQKVWQDFGGVLTLGPYGVEMERFGLIENEQLLKDRWMHDLREVFQELKLDIPDTEPGMVLGDGRAGMFTEDLTQALKTLSEVYRLDAKASW